MSLYTSKHAPRLRQLGSLPGRTSFTDYQYTPTTPQPSQASPYTTPAPAAAHRELSRFQHAVRRLRWKLPYLADAHRRATAPCPPASQDPGTGTEAETMFKLDFYEYYTVLERAIVHLLAVWDLYPPVSRSSQTHTFHASLLSLLQLPSNPLHEVLGRGEVLAHLTAAKTLRNRWKSAEEHGELGNPAPLAAWEIERMLEVIFAAFERADVTARAYLGAVGPAAGAESSESENEGGDLAFVDEMDWEVEVL